MIKGIGVDLVSQARIKKAIERNEHFKARVFTKNEQDYCETSASPWEKYAARFAAKEAFLKVCARGIFHCDFLDIEVLRKETGEPYYHVQGKALHLMQTLGIRHITLSLSHDQDISIAFAVGED